MRTVKQLFKQVRGAFVAAALLSGCIAVLLLSIPLIALQVFDYVLANRDVTTLLQLAAVATAIVIALLVLERVRTRILLPRGRLDRSCSWKHIH